MPHGVAIGILVCLLPLAAAVSGDDPTAAETGSWNGRVRVYGALRAMFHDGQIGSMVTLDTMLPDPDLFAVGALADLAGEITVVGGKAYLSYPDGPKDTRTETTSRSMAAATLLVAAEVPAWTSVRTEHPIGFEELDEKIAELAVSAGMSLDERFPFLLEGDFEDLQWHVVDGSRLTAGGTSHQDHLAASVVSRLDRASATLVGFYSAGDQGVFTHMGSRTHIHCALDEPLSAGHVDDVTIPPGTTVRFPAVSGVAPVFRALEGAWEGTGVLLDRPARFRMQWAVGAGGFVQLSFSSAWVDEQGNATPVLQSEATYFDRAGVVQGVWIDSRAQRIRLDAVASDSSLVTTWTADEERGRTEYIVRSPHEIFVRDLVEVDDGFRVFGEARYRRREPPFGN